MPILRKPNIFRTYKLEQLVRQGAKNNHDCQHTNSTKFIKFNKKIFFTKNLLYYLLFCCFVKSITVTKFYEPHFMSHLHSQTKMLVKLSNLKLQIIKIQKKIIYIHEVRFRECFLFLAGRIMKNIK